MEKITEEINIGEYLAETEFCDFKHPTIQELAGKITKNHKSQKIKAIAIFYWVRDNIPYKFGSWGKKASKVLDEKHGMCTNKALLLTALLRASGISCLLYTSDA